MYKRLSHILLVIMMLISTMNPLIGQVRKNAFTIADDQMVLYINTKLSRAQIDSLLRIADIHNVNTDKITRGDYSELEKNGWVVKRLQKDQIMLLKPLEELGRNPQIKPFIITQSMFCGDNDKRPGYPGKVLYGQNNFTKLTTREMPSGNTRFFLPGYLNAKKVLLSGNFNNWNTLKGLMVKTDSGWIGDLKLKPGEYIYKYIVNGNWTADPYNHQQEDDGYDGRNSIYFKYNYTFKLAGYSKASRVTVTGSFNNWNGNELILTQKNGIWSKQLYLGEGMHTYRFLVDGKPVTDPANPATGVDASGKPVSVLNLGTEVVFKLKGYLNAKNVYLSGEFNGWKPNDIHLKRSADGWLLHCILPQGNYGYRFIIDGNWITDPANPYKCVNGSEVNSFIPVKPNHTFILHGYNSAKAISLSGTFNDWSEFGYTLKHVGQDWKIDLNLKPGKYLYKFLVDGNWLIDPGNKLWEQNQFGTGNSVLWIEP
jgi:hypothetical protein